MPQTLAQMVRAKHPGAYDDLSDQQLEAAVRAKYPGQYDDLPSTPAQTDKPAGVKAEGSTFGEKVGNAAKMIGSALPTVGGTIGGVMGGVPGAAAGGAAGEGLNQVIQHAKEIPGAIVDVARNVMNGEGAATLKGFAEGATHGVVNAGEEAAGQAIGQAAGTGLAWTAGKLAPWLMNRATTRVTERLMREFPNLSDTLIENALKVSEGGEAKALGLLKAAKSKATAALGIADKSGATIPIEMSADLGESLKTALLEKAVKSGSVASKGMTGQPLTAASKRLDPVTSKLFADIEAAAANGGTIDLTPTQADLLKTQLQKESRALYANRGAPNGPKAMGMDATERAEFASRLNDAIDDLAGGYKSANAEAKPLIGAVRGIKQAIRPNGNLYQAMVRPAVGAVLGEEAGRRENGTAGAILGGLAGGYATSPKGMSEAAIVLAHPATAGFLKMLPKPAAQYLIGLLSKEPGQAQQTQSDKQ